MSANYQQLLDAAIQHLEELISRGTRFVLVSSETLASLSPTRPPLESATSGSPLGTSSPQTESPPARAPFRPAAAATLSMPVQNIPAELPSSLLASTASENRAAKEAAVDDLRARALVCQKCQHLAASRKNVVFGVGDIHSPLMFVGEAPGADEDERGEPFVGKAGHLLTRIIQTMGFTRDTVYIANILKCRPDTPGQTTGNRKPTPEEMKTCLPYLLAQIDLIRPRVIVALGATAVEGLLGKTGGIAKLRGRWQEFRGTPLMPTYHPAYLLRNEASSEKRKVWEDMLQVLERLGRPITPKQRNFFLKA